MPLNFDKHGNFSLGWVNDILLCVTAGDFNEEGAEALCKEVHRLAACRSSERWGFVCVNLSGNLIVPEAAGPFSELARQMGGKGLSHSALVNRNELQDQVIESLFDGSGVEVRSFRELDEAVAWFCASGYSITLEQLKPYLPSL